MNCFQIIIFVLTRTAKTYYFKTSEGCELLSNHYLCADKNSYKFNYHNSLFVVNCFQIIIFVLTRTAWILNGKFLCCCELLSNHYLCADKNSTCLLFFAALNVVNCFQIIIFVLTRTAHIYIKKE